MSTWSRRQTAWWVRGAAGVGISVHEGEAAGIPGADAERKEIHGSHPRGPLESTAEPKPITQSSEPREVGENGHQRVRGAEGRTVPSESAESPRRLPEAFSAEPGRAASQREGHTCSRGKASPDLSDKTPKQAREHETHPTEPRVVTARHDRAPRSVNKGNEV